MVGRCYVSLQYKQYFGQLLRTPSRQDELSDLMTIGTLLLLHLWTVKFLLTLKKEVAIPFRCICWFESLPIPHQEGLYLVTNSSWGVFHSLSFTDWSQTLVLSGSFVSPRDGYTAVNRINIYNSTVATRLHANSKSGVSHIRKYPFTAQRLLYAPSRLTLNNSML
jgi:hypothetical protein